METKESRERLPRPFSEFTRGDVLERAQTTMLTKSRSLVVKASSSPGSNEALHVIENNDGSFNVKPWKIQIDPDRLMVQVGKVELTEEIDSDKI